MKIAICTRNFGGRGGQEHFISGLADFLAARGHQPTVLAINGESRPGIELIHVPAFSPLRAARAWDQARALAGALANTRYDVSFGEQKTWGCSVIRPGGGVEHAFWAYRLAGWKTALPRLSRGLLPLKRHFDLMAEDRGYTSPALRRVIANSEAVRDALLHHYPALAGKVDLVYNGADTARFSPDLSARWRNEILSGMGLDPDILTGIFAAHNFREKGLAQALATLAQAQTASRTPIQLVILGYGNDRPFRRMAAALQVAARIRFAGQVKNPERYYAAADFLIHPTFYDPCANVTVEAMAAGIPVITSARNGAHTLITDGQEGWTVDNPTDIDALARAMSSLTDPARLAAMKRAARRRALGNDSRTMFESVERILAMAAGANRRG